MKQKYLSLNHNLEYREAATTLYVYDANSMKQSHDLYTYKNHFNCFAFSHYQDFLSKDFEHYCHLQNLVLNRNQIGVHQFHDFFLLDLNVAVMTNKYEVGKIFYLDVFSCVETFEATYYMHKFTTAFLNAIVKREIFIICDLRTRIYKNLVPLLLRELSR